jgi:hypothetical protein
MTTKTNTKVEPVGDDESLPDVSIHMAIPGELHRRLRIRGIERGLTLKQAMIAAAREWTAST